jgi:hypothetical protein
LGWVVMSERDVRRTEVLSEVVSGRPIAAAASMPSVTRRHVHRLLRWLEAGGGAAVRSARLAASPPAPVGFRGAAALHLEVNARLAAAYKG